MGIFCGRRRACLVLIRLTYTSGAWTGTLLSFMQEVSEGHRAASLISRADECRLMFLSQEPRREFPPIYPYPPLGETDIGDADLGVQIHARCPGSHGLWFLSIAWSCVGGRKDIQTAESTSVMSRAYTSDSPKYEDAEIEVDYSWLDRERDLSEGVTSNLFSWMREMDGYTVGERGVYRHEWVDAFDSDDNESIHPEGDGCSATGLRNDARIGSWMASAMTRRCHSI